MSDSSRRRIRALLVFAILGVIDRGVTSAADIPVTSLTQKISSSGGCSLQEAIFSANFDNNIAIDHVNANGTEHFVTTQCVRGNGADRIILPFGGVFRMNRILDEANNPFGPAATPLVDTDISIRANGSRLEWVGSGHARAFTVLSPGALTIDNAHIKGFSAKGGDGLDGGGGGMGAGGAVFVSAEARLTVVQSTFERNGAIGGNGGSDYDLLSNGGGGGGGLGGNGGDGLFAGGGGGGSRGNGGTGNRLGDQQLNGYGGGGGGTVFPGANGTFGHAPGGARCGGAGEGFIDEPGDDAPCAGGGGAGGNSDVVGSVPLPFGGRGHGGAGNYGGGGGGGGMGFGIRGGGSDGGRGGFGGGGGASGGAGAGGVGGFGGGGGAGASGFGGPGHGGAFAGNGGDLEGGGGGAGLGGAIFSDGGFVHVENSTFASNYAVRGVAKGSRGANGTDAGGAIFSWGGATTVLNSTINRNESTGSGGGIVVVHQVEVIFRQVEVGGIFITVPDVVPVGDTFFTLRNTIISNNGSMDQLGNAVASAKQCSVDGFVPVGVGNLIQDNDGCAGVVQTGDPLLGPLQMNAPGITPTMAITATASAAYNTADVGIPDGGTSLPTDQRGLARPMDGGFDIGAFERCVEVDINLGKLPICVRLVNVVSGDTFTLTTLASPPVGGTVSPASGAYPLGSVVLVTATPNPGYFFVNWTGNVGDASSASTVVVVNQPETVTANFALASTDTVAPTTTAVVSPAPNAAGWNNTAATVDLSAVDNPGGSGVKQITYSVSGAQVVSSTIVPGDAASIPITVEGTSLITFSATDNAGNVEAPNFLTIKLDETGPTISGAAIPAPNANGWNRTPVTVSFQCADALSGLAAGSPPAPTTLSANAAGQLVAGLCTDAADNSGSALVQGINIDMTPPVVTPPSNQVVQQSSAGGASVTYPPPTIVETLSGLESSSCAPVSGSIFPVGVTTVTCTATDRAGNTGSANFTVAVNGEPDGRMYGVGFVNQSGLHDHFVFRVAQIRNQDYGRLEVWVNDPRRCGSNDSYDRDTSFDGDHDRDYGRDHHNPPNHFEATSMNVVFSDDPRFRPGPGPRPLVDTVRLSGTGKWNGRSGYTYEASATDQGEPGRHRDTFSIVVKDGHGRVVAAFSGVLEGGNIQSTRLSR
jgi:hypothetical protein